MDPKAFMIETEEDVWKEYVKVHPDVDGFKTISFPLFEDWKLIFGKERATGKGACEFKDAILQLQHPHVQDDPVFTSHVLHGAAGKDLSDDEDVCPTVNLDSDDSQTETNVTKNKEVPDDGTKTGSKRTKKQRGTKRKMIHPKE